MLHICYSYMTLLQSHSHTVTQSCVMIKDSRRFLKNNIIQYICYDLSLKLSYASLPVWKLHSCSDITSQLYKPTFYSNHLSLTIQTSYIIPLNQVGKIVCSAIVITRGFPIGFRILSLPRNKKNPPYSKTVKTIRSGLCFFLFSFSFLFIFYLFYF